MRKRDLNRLLQEVHDLTNMLDAQGDNHAENRYKEIVASVLLLILDGLSAVRTLLCILLGLLAGHLLGNAIFG